MIAKILPVRKMEIYTVLSLMPRNMQYRDVKGNCHPLISANNAATLMAVFALVST